MKTLQRTILGGAIALASFQVAALPFAGIDARSISMGGTGVAAGNVTNASTFNPALLAAYREDEDFNFSLALGALVRDEDNMLDAIDELQQPNFAGNDVIQQFSADMVAFENAVNTEIYTNLETDPAVILGNITEDETLQASAANLTAALNNLGNKPIEVGFNVGFNISIPSDSLGVSVFANSRAIVAGTLVDVDQDTADITNIVDLVTSPAITLTELDNLSDPFAGGNSVQSKLVLNGGAVTESGVALATKILGVAIGVTPKIVRIDTIESTTDVNSVDTNNIDDTGEVFEDANFDVGVAIDLGALKIGAVAKNMIEQEYTLQNSVLGSKVVLEPQVRAGIAFDAGWATLTMDQDLTENKGVISNSVIGDSQNSQYTSLGIEFDLALVQIRAGMRTDNTGNADDVMTAGIGIHALVTFDLAVAGNDQGVEGVVQLGMRW